MDKTVYKNYGGKWEISRAKIKFTFKKVHIQRQFLPIFNPPNYPLTVQANPQKALKKAVYPRLAIKNAKLPYSKQCLTVFVAKIQFLTHFWPLKSQDLNLKSRTLHPVGQ